ncbi:phosphate-starvation-inducible protein PsiE [Dyella japonica]|uniref:Protein PsiE n=1 Tax=Dyella japonica A8 TaxID=1217721 RepID=A0A075JZR1_9GAMM|nr:phosphate-starvation-inducible PsiE family protein [Dyella japonica]AIF47571.1 phosphate-starvation-inducible E [Dyella japonica A8]
MTGPISLDVKQLGSKVIVIIEHVGLLIVLVAAVFAGTQEIADMWRSGRVGVSDLLLLFIYLEVVTMSSVYWRIGRLPVRIPLYIAMVAMSRHLILNTSEVSPWTILAESGAILILAMAVLMVRYGHTRMPYTDEGSSEQKSPD